MRNAFVAMMISHGTPMILGGDEWLRTQFGNNNAYSDSADNQWNWFQWGEWGATGEWHRHRMHDFVRKLIQFRKRHTYALSPADWGAGMIGGLFALALVRFAQYVAEKRKRRD